VRLSRRASGEVFVIGGGPAGLAAAIAARRQGFTVTVADGADPVIDKACGEGLMPATQEALAQLGVELPASLSHRFRGIRFLEQSAEVAADFPCGLGIGIRRTLLHRFLVRETEKCGVRLLWNSPVSGIESGGVRLNHGFVSARWIIGADGAHSRVRRWSKLDSTVTNRRRFAARRHYRVRPWSEFMEIYWGPRVQGYVTPIASEEVCVVMMGEGVEDVEFERALMLLPKLRERLAGAEPGSRDRGAITASRSLVRVWRDNVALVGDASGGVDAITGDGLRLAFQQAAALAAAMERGDLREYQRAHRRLARRPLWMGAILRQLARYDRLRGRALQMLSRNPDLFARLLAVHVGRATGRDVVVTGGALGWQFLTVRGASGE
jgi:flavin-dependent dehydrogenase